MPRRLALAVTPLLLAAALVGCSEQTRIPPAEPPAAQAPLFASDEEALAAATAAYEEYLAVSNAVTSDPNASLSELEALTTQDYFLELEVGVEQLRSQGLRSVGTSRSSTIVLQQFEQSPGYALVTIYVCLDVTDARLVDADGKDVTPGDRDNLVELEVSLLSEDSQQSLVVADSESWPGGNICE